MMLKIDKTLIQRVMAPACVGLLALGSVVLFGALTYIPEETFAETTGNATVSVNVQSILTLAVSKDADKGESVEITADNSKVATGTFTATVSSNQRYSLSLSARDSGATANALTNGTNESIPAVADNTLVQAGVSGWGIRACTDTQTCSEATNVIGGNPYLGVGLQNSNKQFFSSTTGVQNQVTTFEVGIGVSSNLSSGIYTTTIAVTAAQY